MSLASWPKSERPREKLLQFGADNLTDAELVAIIFNFGTLGKSAFDLARDLLQHFDGLHKLLQTDRRRLLKCTGIGPTKYSQLQAVRELGKRYQQIPFKRGLTIIQSTQAARYFQTHLRDCEQEIFAALFLDNKNRFIHFEKLFYGSINMTQIYPREVIKRALYHNAAAMIIGHNHPSGMARPSQADIEMTRLLAKALDLIEVRLLDHLIIGDCTICSLAERGLVGDKMS